MKKAKRYQVKVAKSTITEEGIPSYIDPNKWYDVTGPFYADGEKGLSPNKMDVFWVAKDESTPEWIVTVMKEACHLNGGNWRLRVVKDA